MSHTSIFHSLKKKFTVRSFVSRDYWEKRYAAGGTSGDGSYGHMAEFKAQTLNTFVQEHQVASIIEFGCGDGNQLRLAKYPNYIGLDVSPTAIARCAAAFTDDLTKSFFLYDPNCFVDNAHVVRVDLALSLDVLFHLIEDDIYEKYMSHLFNAAKRFVIIYSWSKTSPDMALAQHNRFRDFEAFVAAHFPSWGLMKVIENIYPYNVHTHEGSLSDFYIYTFTGV